MATLTLGNFVEGMLVETDQKGQPLHTTQGVIDALTEVRQRLDRGEEVVAQPLDRTHFADPRGLLHYANKGKKK